MNGKGSKPRPVNRAKWDGAEYWRRLEVRKAAKGGERLTGGVATVK